jgi:hypothetical protein
LDDSFDGRWATDIDPKDSALFMLHVPGSPFSVLETLTKAESVLDAPSQLPVVPNDQITLPPEVPPPPPGKTNEELLAEVSALPKKAEIASWAKEHLSLDIDWQHTNRADCLQIVADHLTPKE